MKLDAYLKQQAITQREFAERIGCEQPTIARFLAGRVPTPDLMRKIVDETSGAVTPNDFFGITPEADPQMARAS